MPKNKENKNISRRAFLGVGALTLADIIAETQGVGFVSQLLKVFLDPRYSNEFQRDGSLVVLPSQGTLYIASDFHSRYTDFDKWLSKTNLVEKLKQGEDVYGLILGDAVDKKPGDPFSEKEGDSRIVDKIREIQESFGERLIYIAGNHEFMSSQIYEVLGLNSFNQRRKAQELYSKGEYYTHWNFIERMTHEQFEYLNELPLGVLTKSGVICVHAGPSKIAGSPKDIAKAKEEVIDHILWGRPNCLTADIYDEFHNQSGNFDGNFEDLLYEKEDVTKFLRRMNESSLLVVGHTPLSWLKENYLQDGVGVFGNNEIILATSYGYEPGEKSYLVLDLGRRYDSVHDLKLGKEIQRLE